MIPYHLPVDTFLFQPWQRALTLRNAGYKDEAMVYFIHEVPYSGPTDCPELCKLAPSCNEAVTLALDENLLWCRCSRTLAQQIVRLLQAGRIALHVHVFSPNDPKVMTGHRAKLLPVEALSCKPLFVARRQPAGGFRTAHHLRAALIAGPNANIEAVGQILNDIEIGKIPYYGAGPAAEAEAAEPALADLSVESDTQGAP